MSVIRCDAYQPSGLEWLPEVPKHWDVRPMKRLCAILPSNVDKKTHEGESPVRLCNYTDVYYNDLITADMDLMTASASDEQIAKFTLRQGDTIITKDSESADDIAVSAYVPADLPRVVCGYHLAILRPQNSVHGPFMKHLFDSHYIRACVAVRANGLTRVGLSQDALGTLPVPVPPFEEQALIAGFLKQETAKLDSLIAEQRLLIERLGEKRQALISHAVTKGLNRDAPMKPSLVEGLGEVPAHWRVLKMKWVAQMESGHTPDKKVPAYWDGDIPWVSLNDTGYLRDNDHISATAHNITSEGIANSSAHLLPPGAVVFSRDATIGRCAITAIPMAVSQHFIAWLPSERITSEYLLLRLRSMTQELDRLTTGATVKTIGMPEVRTLATPVPPLDEQRDIVCHVRKETATIDALMEAAEHAIELLQERRIAVISAAVTGQIDVRSLAALGVV